MSDNINVKLDDILEASIEWKDKASEILEDFKRRGVGAQVGTDLWIYAAMLRYLKPKNVLEFSCAEGLTTSVLARMIKEDNMDTKLYTFDIHEPHVRTTEGILKNYGIEKYECFVHDMFTELPEHIKDLDLVYIDANHTAEGGKAVIKMLEGRVKENFTYFVHDVPYDKNADNEYGIISINQEWKSYIGTEEGIKGLKTILLTGKHMATSKYSGIDLGASRAIEDVGVNRRGFSMILSNHLIID